MSGSTVHQSEEFTEKLCFYLRLSNSMHALYMIQANGYSESIERAELLIESIDIAFPYLRQYLLSGSWVNLTK